MLTSSLPSDVPFSESQVPGVRPCQQLCATAKAAAAAEATAARSSATAAAAAWDATTGDDAAEPAAVDSSAATAAAAAEATSDEAAPAPAATAARQPVWPWPAAATAAAADDAAVVPGPPLGPAWVCCPERIRRYDDAYPRRRRDGPVLPLAPDAHPGPHGQPADATGDDADPIVHADAARQRPARASQPPEPGLRRDDDAGAQHPWWPRHDPDPDPWLGPQRVWRNDADAQLGIDVRHDAHPQHRHHARAWHDAQPRHGRPDDADGQAA
eukprot:scaffold129232_cov44-Prasinocladus_malaysianus.AAC.1